MSHFENRDEIANDIALLEKVNPVFHTAKMTLYQLAEAGDSDAAELSAAMGLTWEATQDSATTTASPEQVLGNMIMIESRYRTIAALAEASGYTLVDLPCGYTPRSLAFARRGLPYYGLDLPIVIQEISERVDAMLSPEQRGLVHYRGVDATNRASLEGALEDIDGGVCITTEGLLMYLTDSEAGAVCDNVRCILEQKGGCWYVADMESFSHYVITIRALAGERFMQVAQNVKQQIADKSDVTVGRNSLIVLPIDIEGGTKRAMAFLAEHGLKAERMIVGDHMSELDSLSRVTPEQAHAIREGMKSCAFWRIVPGNASPSVELPSSETGDLAIHASRQGDTLSLSLTGRLDTITAPDLLVFFEETNNAHPLDAVVVDCSCLDYISSAGLRVLVIMRKACPGGVTLASSNELVREIIGQTGFTNVLTIE